MNKNQPTNLFLQFVTIMICVAFISSFLGVVQSAATDPLNADFYWMPEEPTDLQTINFHDNSSGDPIVWIWDFGDGVTATNQNPIHLYTDNGMYTVRLTIWDNVNAQSTVTKNIMVANVPPIADAGGDRIVNNHQVVFNASASQDPDGIIDYYYWDFSDGSTAVGMERKNTFADDGIYIVTLNITDNDGAYDKTVVTITIDTVSPVTNVTLNGTKGKNDWYQNNVTVTLNATDGLSGVTITWYEFNATWFEYTASFEISEEGITIVTYYSVDNATNQETNSTVAVSIDNTPPVTNATLDGTLGVQGWYQGTVTATLTANDTLSGVDTLYYQVDDGDWEVYESVVTMGSNGEHTLSYYAVDNASNEEMMHNITFGIDNKDPEVELTVPEEGYLYLFGKELFPTLLGSTQIIGSFTAIATATDDHTDIYAVFFKIDDDVLEEDYTAPYEAPLYQIRGTHTLSVTAYDGAGNTATSAEVDFIKIFRR